MNPDAENRVRARRRRQYISGQLKALPFVIALFAVWLGFYFAPAATAGTIAAGLVGLALVCVFRDVLLSRRGLLASGEVVDHRLEEDCVLPVIEFADASGVVRRETTRTGNGMRTPPVGSRVAVIYDPAGKLGCEIDTFWRRWGVTILLLFLGLAFAIGAVSGLR